MSDRVHPSEEHRLLSSLDRYFNRGANPRYTVGVGDDAAVRRGGRETVVITADAQVEGVHFTTDRMSMPEIGYRAMAVNLSDCAAMGALPDSALIQIVFPAASPAVARSVRELYRGFSRACRRWHFPIVGGDMTRGPCWIIAITLLGTVANRTRVLSRGGARPGDGLWVSGTPGESAAGRAAVDKWGRPGVPRTYAPLVKRHVAPTPRIDLGLHLARQRTVHAAIDISDGVSKECHTLAYESGLGVLLEESAFPCSRAEAALAGEFQANWVNWFLDGGEDYELMFAASPRFVPEPGVDRRLTRIGWFTKATRTVSVVDSEDRKRRLDRGGWDHLRKDLPAHSFPL